jgi:exodeoxyribonuclease VII small subunit
MTDPLNPATPAAAPQELAPAERQRIATLPFDRAMDEFKSVVERLETGRLPLEESMALFEQGVLLQRRCEELLSQAELRFQRLVEGSGGQLRTLDLSLGEGEEA